MGPLDAALFDLDGTLVDSAEDILRALAHTLERAGLARAPDPRAGRPHLGHPLHVMMERMGYRVPRERREELMAEYAAYYMAHWKDRSRLYGGVTALLDGLGGLAKAVVTQKRQDQAEGMVEAFGLGSHFRAAVGWRPGLRAKPAPDLLLRAAGLLGVRPGRAVMVGDTELDIEAGRAAGMATVGVTWGFAPEERVRAARPDAVAGTVEELGRILGAWRAG